MIPKSLFIWFEIIVALALPLIIILAFGYGLQYEDVPETIWFQLSRFLYLVMGGPIAAVYGFIVIKRFSPENLLQQLYTIGILLSTIIYNAFFTASLTSVLDILVVQAVILYSGLYIVMLSGLAILATAKLSEFNQAKSGAWRSGENLARILVLFIIASPIILTIIIALGMGTERGVAMSSLVIQSVFIAASYYPQFIVLYREGKL